MEICIQSTDDNLVRIQLSGRITQDSRSDDGDPLAQAAGQDVYGRRVLLDMEPVEFLDSSGIGWLLSMNRQFREQGGALALHSVPPLVANALKLLRLDQVMTIADDARDAERSLGLDTP